MTRMKTEGKAQPIKKTEGNNKTFRGEEMEKSIYRCNGEATPVLTCDGGIVSEKQKEKFIIALYEKGYDIDDIVAKLTPTEDLFGEKMNTVGIRRTRALVKRVIENSKQRR